MTVPNLSDAALLSHVTPQVFARGQDYATSGAVAQIVQRGNHLSAAVEGSEYEPYRVEITTEASTVVSAACSCPYDFGGWCKHIVAVLLALVRRAYQHAGRSEEWRQYEAQLRDTHGRKRKLMDMLRQIGK